MSLFQLTLTALRITSTKNATTGTIVHLTANATDGDATTNGINYTVDNDGGRFVVDSNTGVVTVAGVIDRETDGASRTIIIRATSTDGSTADGSFTIDINDLDELT
ncbi:MAG: cadherin repeat domain-containing protein [Planctomycetaceae bacterium]